MVVISIDCLAVGIFLSLNQLLPLYSPIRCSNGIARIAEKKDLSFALKDNLVQRAKKKIQIAK